MKIKILHIINDRACSLQLIAGSFLLLFPIFCFSQDLIANGSFEDENVCTEYQKHCAPEAWIFSSGRGDEYFINPSMAVEGSHFMAVEAGFLRWMSDRTFIRSQLLCKLRKGNSYKVTFYIKSKYDLLDSVGIYFTEKDFLFERKPVQSRIASAYAKNGTVVPRMKDTSWQKVELVYTAKGDEAFITIGNFARQHSLEKIPVFRERHMLIFIDNVSMIPLDPNETICADWEKTKTEIYNFNVRHNYLQRYIETYINDPPAPELSKTITQVIDTLVLPDILFETGKSSLTTTSHHYLDSILSIMLSKKIDSIVVEGHTDSVGKFSLNQKLSLDRAITVVNYLKQKLLPVIFNTRGWASEKPVADNRTAAGRQKNRRVEIYLYVRE